MLHDAKIFTMLLPHFAPSGTRPGIISDPGSVVKDLIKNFMKGIDTNTDRIPMNCYDLLASYDLITNRYALS